MKSLLVCLQIVHIFALIVTLLTPNSGHCMHRFFMIAKIPALIKCLLAIITLENRWIYQMHRLTMVQQIAPVAIAFPAIFNIAHVMPLHWKFDLLICMRIFVCFQFGISFIASHTESAFERFVVIQMAFFVLHQFVIVDEGVLTIFTAHHE